MNCRESLRGSVGNYRAAKQNKNIENAKQQTTGYEVMGPPSGDSHLSLLLPIKQLLQFSQVLSIGQKRDEKKPVC